jgi:hypothetical protein
VCLRLPTIYPISDKRANLIQGVARGLRDELDPTTALQQGKLREFLKLAHLSKRGEKEI